ncbi:scavenger receptor cysteine-rich type 1 protein M160 [Austrofundulus limnaeus]|uniref:Scavenger receptor cysteine-rich type 1 protein M160 n=1 Tax=Austrofundulus limnaeus TaxID=52670 RepID=A0A2I4ATK4_AUSLI|nr:PREDICTED: scavenger receptor cysteine-rich type 1 protein M160-like [Austrofundulus limnaeus]
MDLTALIIFLSVCSSGLWAEHIAVVSDFRLVDGTSSCNGKLEMKRQDVWREVLDWRLNWTLTSAAEVCRQLNCGSVVSLRRNNFYFVFIACSDSVRLVNGTGLCSGRLEVNFNQSWTSVSEGGFDQQSAEVVCRELDCGPPSVLQGVLYGDPDAPTWSEEFQCEGTESVLWDCGRSVRKYSGKAVGLSCSEPVDSIRLVGGGSRCNGRLEINHGAEWKGVSDDARTHSFAGEVCKQLDCGSPVSLRYKDLMSVKEVWELNADCGGSPLTKCVTGITFSTDSTEVTCSDSVRLVNGTGLCSGRLEINFNQSWFSVSEDGFDQQRAEVVCRELDCGPPSVLHGVLYGEPEAPTWTKAFQCKGTETALWDCGGSIRTYSGKAVGLRCSDAIRLVGGASRCAGTLEMIHQKQWRPVVDWNNQWNKTTAAAVCAQLGCGSVVSTTTLRDSSYRPVWWIKSSCLQPKSALRHCLYDFRFNSNKNLELICSGKTKH